MVTQQESDELRRRSYRISGHNAPIQKDDTASKLSLQSIESSETDAAFKKFLDDVLFKEWKGSKDPEFRDPDEKFSWRMTQFHIWPGEYNPVLRRQSDMGLTIRTSDDILEALRTSEFIFPTPAPM